MELHTYPEADSMPLVIENQDVEGGDDEDILMIPSPVAGTATTPSESQDDDRMVLGDHSRLSPIPPEPGLPAPDMVMAPPSPPALNLIPATPQQSQEGVRPGANTLEPGEIQDRAPPARARARACSRTPFGMQPIASSSRLEPPATRSRSRSKTPV
jgi:hypothetical protein